MSKDLLAELLNKIHHYYPIGIPQLTTSHKGFAELKKIAGDKVSEQVNQEPGNWKLFSDHLREEVFPYKILDRAYFQFPCYKLDIEIFHGVENGTLKIRSLVLVISLLTDYYTVFFEDMYQFISLTSELSMTRHPQYHILYNLCNKDQKEIQLVEKVKEILPEYYPSHSFVHHQILFDAKIIGGIPYGEEYSPYNQVYSFYEFLFLNSPYAHPFTVLE